MASELADRVHRAYTAFAERDIDTMVELTDPEVRFTSLVMESEGTEYHGHDGLREYFARLVDVLPDWRPELREIEEHDDRVLIRARIIATPPGGSVPLEQEMWQVIRFRDDRAMWWGFFRTEEEARDALAG